MFKPTNNQPKLIKVIYKSVQEIDFVNGKEVS